MSMRQFGTWILGAGAILFSASTTLAAPAAESAKTATIAPPAVIPPAPFAPPSPRRIRLPTGMQFEFVPREGTRLIDVSIVFKNAGAAFESGPRGATAMAADLLLEGTKTKDATELANAIALLGANLSAQCGTLTCRIDGHAPVTRAAALMALAFEIASAPRFDEEALARKKAEKAAGFAARVDDPQAISRAAVQQVLYGAHPLGFDSDGTPASVAALTRDDVVAAWKNSFHKANATVVVAADANVIEMLKLVVTTSAPLAAKSRKLGTSLPDIPPMVASKTAGKPDVILIDKPGAAQSVVVVAGRAPESLEPLTANVKAFETLFGGSFTSRLNQNLREKNGYAYGARFSVGQVDAVRPWQVSTSVATKDTGPAVGEIAIELKRILTPATEAEVTRAKTYRALTFPDAFATGADIAGFFAWASTVDLPQSKLAGYSDALLAVDVKGLQAGANRVLTAGPMTYVIVGDRAKIEGPLKKAIEEQGLGTLTYKSNEEVFAAE